MLAAFACVDFPAIADKPAAAAILAPPTRTLRREVAGSFFLFMGFLRIWWSSCGRVFNALAMWLFRFGVDTGSHRIGVTPGQEAEDVRHRVRFTPGVSEMRPNHHVLGHGDDLLADEDAEQPYQRHHGRRRRSHVEPAVDDADQD